MLTLVSKYSVKNSDHFDVLCVLIACMVLEIINQNQMSKKKKSSLIVWNTVRDTKNFRNAYNLSQSVLEKLVKISFQKHTISGEEFLVFMLVIKCQECSQR